jgi:hypothetical protein
VTTRGLIHDSTGNRGVKRTRTRHAVDGVHTTLINARHASMVCTRFCALELDTWRVHGTAHVGIQITVQVNFIYLFIYLLLLFKTKEKRQLVGPIKPPFTPFKFSSLSLGELVSLFSFHFFFF